jgi:hypothetical protein
MEKHACLCVQISPNKEGIKVMVNVWLVRAITGRIRVKWIDEDGFPDDRDFDTEREARAFGAGLGGNHLEFRADMETMYHAMGMPMEQNPGLTQEEAMTRVGIETIRFKPGASARRENPSVLPRTKP